MTTTPVRVITTLNNSQPPHSPSLVTEYNKRLYSSTRICDWLNYAHVVVHIDMRRWSCVTVKAWSTSSQVTIAQVWTS